MERKRIIKDTYDILQKNRKKIKRRSIFLASFLFCINIYAWFIFSSNANGTIAADIVSWSVSFYENNEAVREFNVSLDDMYPGMNAYTRSLDVKNASDVDAIFAYEITSMTLFGTSYNIDGINLTSNQLVNKLKNDFPFSIDISSTKTELIKNDTAIFSVVVSWPYQSVNSYYKLTNDYDYVSYYNYYTYNGTYIIDYDITSTNFLDNVVTGLYIESDDADGYFGEKCSAYKISNPDSSCLLLNMKLTVTQKDE